jgi:hypothetical protein
MRQREQLEFEARRAFEQYNEVDARIACKAPGCVFPNTSIFAAE